MDFNSAYAHGFARVAACTTQVRVADPNANLHGIVEAIKQILEGQRWLPSDVRQRVSEIRLRSADIADKLATLTPSQFRVLMMLVDGRKNKEIADEICVTEATIKAHLTEIFKKLDVSNRTQAAMLAANYLEVDNPNTLS